MDRTETIARQGRFRSWHARIRTQLGPASGARTVFDRVAAPLFKQLGYRVIPLAGSGEALNAALQARGPGAAGLVVTGWGRDGSAAWRAAVRHGIGLDARWSFCVSGPDVRIVDSRRTYSGRFMQFALEATLEDEKAFQIFWSLVRAEAALPAGPADGSTLDRAVALSEQHRTKVRTALQEGVQDGLVHLLNAFGTATSRRGAGRSVHASRTFDEALIVIYRVLFLLFAEARGLVPRWHPVYRDGYTIEALRDRVEFTPRPRGLWETLQAIARLAHEGCTSGALRVPPFNGRLFSPAQSPLADTLALDDGAVREAVLALTTRPARTGRVRVAYGDLGVEQLGGVYERLLALEPVAASPGAKPLLVPSETRKATGSFYTPRSLTEFVVRRTLAPLVQDASAEDILKLRVLDPAMGSGAFLVAACRYLAAAYEAALVREGGFAASDITEHERVEFRRAIAQRCLFGVDLNPMAVQLGRLSLWLATLSADRPLSFLDHRLRVGNSLVGATLEDLRRQPPSAGRGVRPADLPLFDGTQAMGSIGAAVAIRSQIALEPDDSLACVRAKEQALARLTHTSSALMRWKAAADLWCAGWFRSASRRQAALAFGALMDGLLGRGSSLPAAAAAPLLAEAREIAGQERFFHWTLEYPEIFYDAEGQPLEPAGFDAILGNPPWEMLRADRGTTDARTRRRDDASRLHAFARSSGVYRFQGTGHANLYQLFIDRAAGLLRPGGRLGMVLPSGFALDHGSAPLRRALFDRMQVDGLISIENRQGVFPIHRGLRFLILSATKDGRTTDLPCRFGIGTPEMLDSLPDTGRDSEAVLLSRGLIERLSGSSMAVPELRTTRDVAIVSDLAFRWPTLADENGWNVRFGRELNATDDRAHFVEAGRASGRTIPVIEGKHVSPFSADLDSSTLRVRLSAANRLLNAAETFGRARLAYRDVASASNRLSLIAAIVPAGVVTTHTLFCLKDALDDESQQYLCGLFNSFVANYLIRPRITTHVGAGVISRLPAPRPPHTDAGFRQLAGLATLLASTPAKPDLAARLQATAARVYGVGKAQLEHILDTFPLVPMESRKAALLAFCDIVS
ncbi:MAG TPA: N-6 DNA methylase [Vicinamibacterales bacterium]|nr:N-6 DNA methylase [Vicinamibacterales bacterium]